MPLRHLLLATMLSMTTLATVVTAAPTPTSNSSEFGRYDIRTIPFRQDLPLRTATYTASGKVLVAYAPKGRDDEHRLDLAVMNDDGSEMRTFFSQKIPERPKDNGIRFMMFADNQRIFLGDFVIECAPSIDDCDQSKLLPVEYPDEVADGKHIGHRWSEIIIAPDNESIAWTTLLANYSAMVFTGRLERRDTADSVVQELVSGDITALTDTPGYNETTIFAPDERIGIVMSPRFSPASDLAILGLMPKPYPANLNMGPNMHVYTHAVTGVRQSRDGNIGPVLIDIEKSKHQSDYRGLNLSTQDEWVFHSPMSWHPDSTRAMWLEGQRGGKSRLGKEMRMQVVQMRGSQAGNNPLGRGPRAPYQKLSTPVSHADIISRPTLIAEPQPACRSAPPPACRYRLPDSASWQRL